MHRINQYVIKEEIGRGSFGAVHLAVDVDGNEYVRKQEILQLILGPYGANIVMDRLSKSFQNHDCESVRGPISFAALFKRGDLAASLRALASMPHYIDIPRQTFTTTKRKAIRYS